MSLAFSLFFLLIALVFVGFAWQFANLRGSRSRGRRRQKVKQRKSDRRQLSRNEKRLYKESQRLLAQKKIAPAARVLEQIHMHREAIQALEDADMIHEAAKILMRMQKHNRAGVIYARHGLWEQAANCFRMARMPAEVGKCAREAGNFAMAGENFEKAARHSDAAECYEKNLDYHAAARNYMRAGEEVLAIKNYRKFIKVKENITTLALTSEELDFFVKHLASGQSTPEIADVVIFQDRLKEVLHQLLDRSLVDAAVSLYSRSEKDVGPQLMAEITSQNGKATTLAQVFLRSGKLIYAGMLFERLQMFDKAGSAFESGKDYERAIYCFERQKNQTKVEELRALIRAKPEQTSTLGDPNRAFSFQSSSAKTQPRASIPKPPTSTNSKLSSAPAPARAEDETRALDQTPTSPRARNSKALAPPTADLDRRFSLREQVTQIGPLPMTQEPSPPKSEASRPNVSEIESRDAQAKVTTLKVVEAEPVGGDTSQIDGSQYRKVFYLAKFIEDLTGEQKDKLWAIGRTYVFENADNILHYDIEPTGVYIILDGTVSCFRKAAGGEQFVDKMEPGETFGELWLLAGHPTAVRFAAATNVRVHIIDREEFNELLDNDGTIARKIYKKFAMRLLRRLITPENQNINRQVS